MYSIRHYLTLLLLIIINNYLLLLIIISTWSLPCRISGFCGSDLVGLIHSCVLRV